MPPYRMMFVDYSRRSQVGEVLILKKSEQGVRGKADPAIRWIRASFRRAATLSFDKKTMKPTTKIICVLLSISALFAARLLYMCMHGMEEDGWRVCVTMSSGTSPMDLVDPEKPKNHW